LGIFLVQPQMDDEQEQQAFLPRAQLESVKAPVNDDGRKGSTLKAFWNCFKGMYGSAILALPHVFHHSGVLTASLAYLVVTFAVMYSYVVLFRTKDELVRRTKLEESRTGMKLTETPEQLTTYPGIAGILLGDFFSSLLSGIIISFSILIAVAWLIVCSDQLAVVTQLPSFTYRTVPWMLLPLLLMVNSIKWLSKLWWLSFLGLIVYLVGVMGTVYIDILVNHDRVHTFEITDWSQTPKMLGLAVFSLESIMLVLPIQESMQKPQHAPAVVVGSTFLFALSGIVFGTIASIYGLGKCDISGGVLVTDCMPPNGVTTVVRMALVVSLLVSFPLVMYPAVEIMDIWWLNSAVPTPLDDEVEKKRNPFARVCNLVSNKFHNTRRAWITGGDEQEQIRKRTIVEMLNRWGPMTLACFIASFVSNFAGFVGIVGGLYIPFLGFILPGMVHYQAFSRPRALRIKLRPDGTVYADEDLSVPLNIRSGSGIPPLATSAFLICFGLLSLVVSMIGATQ